MTTATAEPIAAPTAAPAAPVAPAAAPVASSPAPAAAPAAPESLIHGEPGASAAPAAPGDPAAAADPFAALLGKVPEKFHVKAEGDKLDPAATLAKALEHRDHLEKRLGAGDIPPKTAAEYGFQMPPDMADLQLKSERMEAFKVKAHELGFTQSQFEFAMSSYLAAVPDLMEGAAALTAAQARAELQKVWTTPGDFDTNMANAQRAVKALPPALFEATRAFGTDPAFLQAMAHFGAQMREDRPPGGDGGSQPSGSNSIDSLMAHPAYTNPKHPQHAEVSRQVADYWRRVAGTAPI